MLRMYWVGGLSNGIFLFIFNFRRLLVYVATRQATLLLDWEKIMKYRYRYLSEKWVSFSHPGKTTTESEINMKYKQPISCDHLIQNVIIISVISTVQLINLTCHLEVFTI